MKNENTERLIATEAILKDAEAMFSMWCKLLAEKIKPGNQDLEVIRTLCIKVGALCDEILISRATIKRLEEDERGRENVQ